jgi:hypothetical protein
MAERTRFVQEFPSLSGPYQTEPVPSPRSASFHTSHVGHYAGYAVRLNMYQKAFGTVNIMPGKEIYECFDYSTSA